MLLRKAASAWGASQRCLFRPFGVLAVAALAACAAGCSSSPSNGRLALASVAASGATVAFESIDGPPPEVFNKLVTGLNEEAGARKITVVSRSTAATYRVRGYVSAIVDRDKTSFSWVWDIYDAEKRRALRITGEEPAGAARRRDTWTAADEQVVRRMARNGMDQIAAFLNSPEPGSAPIMVPEQALVTLASAHDDSPEAAGIFRLFGGQDQSAGAAPGITAEAPSPAEPPKAKPRAKKMDEKHPATAKHASAASN